MRIISLIIIIILTIQPVFANKKLERKITSNIQINTKNELKVFIQNRIDEIQKSSSFSDKIKKYELLNTSLQDMNASYEKELLDLYDSQETEKDSAKLADINKNINRVEDSNDELIDFFVAFKEIEEIFIKKNTSEVNCENFSHKINFRNNVTSETPSETPLYVNMALKMGENLCRSQRVHEQREKSKSEQKK